MWIRRWLSSLKAKKAMADRAEGFSLQIGLHTQSPQNDIARLLELSEREALVELLLGSTVSPGGTASLRPCEEDLVPC